MKRSIFILAFMLIIIGSVSAQLKERDNLLGLSLGFWPKHSVPTFGVNFENQVVQAGIGTIGLGGVFRYYGYSSTYPYADYKYSFTSFGFQANYNFNEIGDGRFVPFVGLVVGYNGVSATYTSVTRNAVYVANYDYSSGMWAWGQLGMRYFFSPKVAGSIRLNGGNYDFNTLELGVDFRF